MSPPPRTTPGPTQTRGRPRAFDRHRALRRAMEVFWAKGYGSATLADLLAAMGGISPPSFYAAFGSKEQLFQEAVALYSGTLGEPMMNVLAQEPDVRRALHTLLRSAAQAFCKPGKPRGCMLVLAAIHTKSTNRTIHTFVKQLRERRTRLIWARVQRVVTEGTIGPTVSATDIAHFVTTVVDGLALQAHNGVSRAILLTTTACAMQALDSLLGSPATDGPHRRPRGTDGRRSPRDQSSSSTGAAAPCEPTAAARDAMLAFLHARLHTPHAARPRERP